MTTGLRFKLTCKGEGGERLATEISIHAQCDERERENGEARLQLVSQLDLVALLIIRFPVFHIELGSDWLVAVIAAEAVRVPLGSERGDVFDLQDRFLAPFAFRFVQTDMASFAVRIPLVDDELSPAEPDFALFILDHLHHRGVHPCGTAAAQLWVQERISTVCTEKVQVVIASLFLFRSDQVHVVDRNVPLVDDRCAAMETPLREQFVVVEMAIGPTLVLVKCYVFEMF
jgi:hypothetical protein